MSMGKFREEHPSCTLQHSGGKRRNKSTFTIPLFLLSTVALLQTGGCGLLDPKEEEYDHSDRLNDIVLSVNDGTIDSPGELNIRNESKDTVLIHYRFYPICNFVLYSVEQKTDSGWIDLYYDYGEWLIENPRHTIVCEMDMDPIELILSKSHTIRITGIRSDGEYRITVKFYYPTPTPPVTEWYELTVGYQVK